MEICPVCDGEIAVGQSFAGGHHDYATHFVYDCEHCGARLDVEVIPEPYFNITLHKDTDTTPKGVG